VLGFDLDVLGLRLGLAALALTLLFISLGSAALALTLRL
jgi:hypothetical protein